MILGCAMPEGEQGLNVARIASLRAGVPVEASAVTVNRFCSSGLQAIAYAAERIMCGFAEVVIAGGTESMSLVPMGGNKVSPNPALVDSYPDVYLSTGPRGREPRARVEDHARGAGRVLAAQPPARDRGDRRRALRGRDRAGAGRGCWARPTARSRRSTPSSFDTDEGPRRDTSIEALAKLRPAFHVAGHRDGGQLVADERRRGRGGRDVRRAREGAGPEAAGALRRLRHRGRGARTVRHRAGAGHPEGAEADRADARSDRPDRAERSLRRRAAVLREGTAHRHGEAQRQRRRDRARPPARLHGRQADDDASSTRCTAGSRATAWSRCASAAAWARPASSSGCRAGLRRTAATAVRRAGAFRHADACDGRTKTARLRPRRHAVSGGTNDHRHPVGRPQGRFLADRVDRARRRLHPGARVRRTPHDVQDGARLRACRK